MRAGFSFASHSQIVVAARSNPAAYKPGAHRRGARRYSCAPSREALPANRGAANNARSCAPVRRTISSSKTSQRSACARCLLRTASATSNAPDAMSAGTGSSLVAARGLVLSRAYRAAVPSGTAQHASAARRPRNCRWRHRVVDRTPPPAPRYSSPSPPYGVRRTFSATAADLTSGAAFRSLGSSRLISAGSSAA